MYDVDKVYELTKERIVSLLKENNLKKKELSIWMKEIKPSKMKDKNLSNYFLRAKKSINLKEVCHIANKFGISIDDLLKK